MRSGSNPLQLSTIRMLVYATLPTLALLCLAEFTVRLTGAAEGCPGYRDSFMWMCDPILYFKANPYQVINGHRLINQAGFRSDEFGPKRAGTYRIIALGDSCTFGVTSPKTKDEFYLAEPYPQRLQRMVAERLGPGRVEVLNASVPGYNSYQGVMLLRTKLRGLRPDLITVRFGWNDHLMSPERHIGNAFHEPSTWVGLKAQDLLLRTALYPFSLRLGMMLRAHWQSSAQPELSPPAVWTPNIPIDEYKHNLTRIVELGRSQGAAVWLLTAPHALLTEGFRARVHELATNPPARLLLQWNAVPSFERLVEIHESYNAATREVGAALGVTVIDMEAAYRQHAAEHLFSEDLLHPTQEGHDLEAEVLYERLVAEKVLPPPPIPP